MMNINQHEDKATNPEPCHPSGRGELLTYECLCFILGAASGWEYGVPENIGWIDTIGVDPSFQKKGMARMLMEEMLNYMKKVGVDTVCTFVNWRDWVFFNFLMPWDSEEVIRSILNLRSRIDQLNSFDSPETPDIRL